MEKFKLKEGEAFIELNNLIKMLGWAATGGEAKAVTDQELVKVNGAVETRRRKKMRVGETAQFEENEVIIE